MSTRLPFYVLPTSPRLLRALKHALQAAPNADAVWALAAAAARDGLGAWEVWTAVGEHAAALDDGLVRAVVDHVGLESAATVGWHPVRGLADNAAFRGALAYPYACALLDATVAAEDDPSGREWRVLKRLAERGVFTAAAHPDAPARLFDVGRGPDRAGYAGAIVPALEVLLCIDDLDPVCLAQLEPELDRVSFRRLSVAGHPAATCAVWRQQLLRPTREVVEFLAGLVPVPAGRTAGGRAPARQLSEDAACRYAACRCAARRCQAYDAFVALALASYPRALAELCARATGGEFRRLFRRLAARSPLEAAGVVRQSLEARGPANAAPGACSTGACALGALTATDLEPLLADDDPWVREAALLALPFARPER